MGGSGHSIPAEQVQRPWGSTVVAEVKEEKEDGGWGTGEQGKLGKRERERWDMRGLHRPCQELGFESKYQGKSLMRSEQ